jgi:hypothetical protein
MRERQPGDRLRVVIAGNIYAKRTLVRRFLEDDGFDVVGEVRTRDELLALDGIGRADAVVVDGDLLDGSVDELRATAPDSAIVVFTSPAGGVASPRGADGYLEKGMGLASLTALLHSLLTDAPASPLGLSWTAPAPGPPPSERRVLAGLAGVAAGVVLVAVVALAVFGGAGTVPISRPIALPSSSPSTSPAPGRSALDLATADLHELRQALAAGRTIEARYVLQDLGAILGAGHPTFATGAFVASAADALRPFLSGLTGSLLDQLRAVFGDVLHIPTGTTSTAGTILTGSTTGSTTSGTGGSDGSPAGGGSATGATTSTGGGASTGGTGSGSGGGTGPGSGSGGGSGGGSEQLNTSHGNGHHYGWTNKPPEGGWHGTKPAPDHAAGPAVGSQAPAGAGDGGDHGNGNAAGHGNGRTEA